MNHPKQKELGNHLWQAEHGWKYDPLTEEPKEWGEPAPKEWQSILLPQGGEKGNPKNITGN